MYSWPTVSNHCKLPITDETQSYANQLKLRLLNKGTGRLNGKRGVQIHTRLHACNKSPINITTKSLGAWLLSV
jgi:hypothetical protein